jgi:tetratricopeptide (TPR) repeat protein
MNRAHFAVWCAGGCVLAAMLAVRSAGGQVDAGPAVVTCPRGSAAIDALRGALAQEVQSIDTRLKLAEALLAQACYGEAVHVLEEGGRLHPRNATLQAKLREARSMLSEQNYFDALGRAEQSAKAERNVLRCRKLGDIPACDAALHERPDDVQLLIVKADALVHADRPSEALALYQEAAGRGAAPREIEEKLAAVESQRRGMVARCEGGDADAALRACDLALLPGAGDEFVVQRRRGVLLQGMGQPSQALDAFIAANLLRSDDEAVSQAIVALTESTGRKDAAAIAARSGALLTLAAEELARSEAPKAAPVIAAVRIERSRALPVATPSPPVVAAAEPMLALEAKRTYSNNDPATRSH